MGTLEGIVTRTGKTGKVGSTLYIGGCEMDDYAKSADILCKGYMCQSVYVPRAIDAQIGDGIELIYGVGFQGKAVIKDVIITPKKKV